MRVVYGVNDELEKWVDLPHGTVVCAETFQRVQDKLQELEAQRANLNRLGTRIYLLTGILFHEDGTTYRGISGTSKTGTRYYYYWNDTNKISVDAEKIEAAVFTSLREAFEDNQELERYAGELKQAKYSKLDVIESQIRRIESDLRKLASDDGAGVFMAQVKERASAQGMQSSLAWLEQQLAQSQARKLDLETSLIELEKEKEHLLAAEVGKGPLRSVVGRMFQRLTGLTPVQQRGFLREIFKRIEVCSSNLVRISWAIPDRDFGGNEFFPSKEWGG